MRPVTALLLVSALAAAPLLAADGARPGGNLLAKSDGGFDRGVAGWDQPLSGSVAHDAKAGNPNAGALAGSDARGSFSTAAPCVAAEPEAGYAARARFEVAAGSVYVCGFAVFQYTDAACAEGQEPFVAESDLPAPGWQAVEASGRTAAGVRSLGLRLVCSGEPGFRVLFDDVAIAGQ